MSKFLSLVLRHNPATAGVTLEADGWVPIERLLAGAAAAGRTLTRQELDEIVARCDKQRFAIDETGTRIRANQGHSTEVEMVFAAAEPPAALYHGTPRSKEATILAQGLNRMARHHVHLSADVETAQKVGARHGKPIVFVIDAAQMRADGYTFFLSANGVWLVDEIPPKYLTILPH